MTILNTTEPIDPTEPTTDPVPTDPDVDPGGDPFIEPNPLDPEVDPDYEPGEDPVLPDIPDPRPNWPV